MKLDQVTELGRALRCLPPSERIGLLLAMAEIGANASTLASSAWSPITRLTEAVDNLCQLLRSAGSSSPLLPIRSPAGTGPAVANPVLGWEALDEASPKPLHGDFAQDSSTGTEIWVIRSRLYFNDASPLGRVVLNTAEPDRQEVLIEMARVGAALQPFMRLTQRPIVALTEALIGLAPLIANSQLLMAQRRSEPQADPTSRGMQRSGTEAAPNQVGIGAPPLPKESSVRKMARANLLAGFDR
jgi:hypothetical protein